MGKKKTQIITQEDVSKLLDSCYEKCLDGLPVVSPDVKKLADDYLKRHETKEKACKALMKNQITKCTVSGFLTGFGGLLTLPVSVPANVGSVLYVQMRMIAATAYMGGYELDCDQTKTFVYACLAGVSVNQLVKAVTVKLGTSVANNLIKKIPGKALVKINQKVGTRFLTKFGERGIINLGKTVPGVGAVIGGSIDMLETRIISKRAYKWFIQGDFTTDEKGEEVEITQEDVEE